MLQRAVGMLRAMRCRTRSWATSYAATSASLARLSTLERTRAVTPEATQRIARIVRDLKSFARLDQASEDRVNMRELIESALAVLKYNMSASESPWCASWRSSPSSAVGSQELNQVFFNVLTNAIQSISEQGTITVSTRTNSNTVLTSRECPTPAAGSRRNSCGGCFDARFGGGRQRGAGLGLRDGDIASSAHATGAISAHPAKSRTRIDNHHPPSAGGQRLAIGLEKLKTPQSRILCSAWFGCGGDGESSG